MVGLSHLCDCLLRHEAITARNRAQPETPTTVILSSHLLSNDWQVPPHVGLTHLSSLVAQAPTAKLRSMTVIVGPPPGGLFLVVNRPMRRAVFSSLAFRRLRRTMDSGGRRGGRDDQRGSCGASTLSEIRSVGESAAPTAPGGDHPHWEALRHGHVGRALGEFLNRGNAEHTARLLLTLQPVFKATPPNMVTVLGDDNSILVGALTTTKLAVLVPSVKSGRRSLGRDLPEPVNESMSDAVSCLHLCPTQCCADKNWTGQRSS